MSKVLVKWSDNWADEMDIEGFVIMTDSEWKEYKQGIKEKIKPFSIGIGTNEEIDYDNGEDLLAKLTAKKLTSEEYKTISGIFGNYWGFDQFQYVIEDNIAEEADELEEEGYYEDEEEEDF